MSEVLPLGRQVATSPKLIVPATPEHTREALLRINPQVKPWLGACEGDGLSGPANHDRRNLGLKGVHLEGLRLLVHTGDQDSINGYQRFMDLWAGSHEYCLLDPSWAVPLLEESDQLVLRGCHQRGVHYLDFLGDLFFMPESLEPFVFCLLAGPRRWTGNFRPLGCFWHNGHPTAAWPI